MSGYPAPCIECGQMVTMVKVKGTSLAVAMDPAPIDIAYWTITEYGYAQRGGGLVEHACKADVVAQFRATWLGDTNLQNELHTAAMARTCPKCGAEPGTECANLTERHKFGRETPTKAPHQERYLEVGAS